MPRSLPDLWGTVYRSSPRVSPPPAPRPDTATLSRLYGEAGAQTESYLRSLGVTPTRQPLSDEGSRRPTLSATGRTFRSSEAPQYIDTQVWNGLSAAVAHSGVQMESLHNSLRDAYEAFGYQIENYSGGITGRITVNPAPNPRANTYYRPEREVWSNRDTW